MKCAGSATYSVGCVSTPTARDRFARNADDLVIALDRRAFRNVARGDLVAGWNEPCHDQLFRVDARAGQKLPGRDDHVVVWMQTDHLRRAASLSQHKRGLE